MIYMDFINFINSMNTYTLKLFNTGQVTLPKHWREKYQTKNFIAKDTREGLLVQHLLENKVVYFEKKDGFGIYCESGISIDDMVSKIKKIHGSD